MEPLARVIGTFGLAAAIINITIGGGIFRLPANVAAALGPAAPLAYLVCAVAMGLIVMCIADAGSRVSLTGGPYAYVGTAFGPYAGFLSGVLLWMLGTFATAAVATVFASNVALLVPGLAGRGTELAILVGVFAFWTQVNLRRVTLGVRLNSIATAAKLLPLLLVAIGGAFFIQPANLAIPAMPAAADVARTSLLLIFAFAGIEVALVPSGEVRDTSRTVPRAIALAMIGITGLYIALQVVAQGILGSGLAQATTAPLADAAGAALGGWARSILLAGAAVSMFGYLGGMTLSMPRVLFALARDGFLPRALATVHPEYKSPRAAVIAQSLVALALAVSGTFEKLAIFANVSALALYFGCALAAWRLRSGGVSIVPWLACAVIVWLLTGLTRDEWLGFGVCVAAGSLVYVLTRGRRGLTIAAIAIAVAAPAAAQTRQAISIRGQEQSLYVYGSPRGDPVIVSSGDGGWIHLGPHVAEFLSARGFYVIGFDVKAYLSSFTSGSSTLRTDQEPGDYRVLSQFAIKTTGKKPILVGVSEGAGLSVLAATDAATKADITGVIGLGLPDFNELGWRWRDMLIYLTHRAPNEPAFSAAAIVNRVTPVPLAAIHSTHDEFVPLAEVQRVMNGAKDPKRLWIVNASNHRFSDNLNEFDRQLLDAIAWVQAHRTR